MLPERMFFFLLPVFRWFHKFALFVLKKIMAATRSLDAYLEVLSNVNQSDPDIYGMQSLLNLGFAPAVRLPK